MKLIFMKQSHPEMVVTSEFFARADGELKEQIKAELKELGYGDNPDFEARVEIRVFQKVKVDEP